MTYYKNIIKKKNYYDYLMILIKKIQLEYTKNNNKLEKILFKFLIKKINIDQAKKYNQIEETVFK